MTETLIRDNVIAAMKQAMREQKKDRLSAIRLIQAAFKQKEVDERIEITDEHALAIFDKMIKQRKDSLSQYKKANREDLAEKEQFEINVIQEFMPAALGVDEIRELVSKTITDIGAASIKDMGKVMAVLKPMLQGKADLTEVSNLVKANLSK